MFQFRWIRWVCAPHETAMPQVFQEGGLGAFYRGLTVSLILAINPAIMRLAPESGDGEMDYTSLNNS